MNNKCEETQTLLQSIYNCQLKMSRQKSCRELNKPDTQDCLKQSDTFQLLSIRSKTGALPTCLGGWRGRM